MCFPALLAAAPAAAAGTAATTAAAAAGTAATTAAAGMSAMQMLSIGASIAGTAVSAMSAYNQGKAAEQVAKNNATIAEYAAQDAQRRGEQDALEIQRKASAIKGTQRVSMAARGLDLGYGTADDLQAQTDFFSQSDVATTRTNADKESWSRRAQKANYEAEALSSGGSMAAAGSLLSSAGTVANKWYTYNRG